MVEDYIVKNTKKQITMKYMPDFTKQDYVLIIDALEKRQHNYIAGDRMYNEYASLADEMRRRMQIARAWRV
tara:strand:+ start:67 stop:279 length:213 start_codon:yes stop_codon:yes gene_type:complete